MIEPHSQVPAGPAQGLIHSLKELLGTVLAIVQTRLELLTNELQEEVHRTAGLLLWAFIGMLAAGFGFLLAALVVIFAFWDTHRLLAAIIVAAVFFGIAITAVMVILSKLRAKPRLLHATLSELERDRERLHPQE